MRNERRRRRTGRLEDPLRIALANVQFHEGNNVFPPLGVLYVAGALRAAGHDVHVVDGDPVARPGLAEEVCRESPEVVGFSFLTMTWERARRLVVDVRARLPNARLIVGGAHATADPSGTLRAFPVDAVVVGEGERTALDLVRRLQDGASWDGVPGVVTAAGAGPTRPFEPSLDSLPFPARDLLGHEPYLRPPGLIRGWASSRIASMLAGRGCPFACSFCESHRQMGTRVRMRSVANVLAELDQLVERDRIRGVYWVDDVFTHDRAWVLELCEALGRRPYRLRWGCQSRVTSVDRRLLEAMRDAGCVQVDFGVESGSARMLKAMHKSITPTDVEEAFSLAHAVGLRTGASFILGSPDETEEDLAATAELARRIDSDWTIFFFSTPYPGTELYERAAPRWRGLWPEFGERWNNRVGPTPLAHGGLDPALVLRTRARLQNRHFARNYLHLRNVPFMLRLARTLPRPEVRAALGRVLVAGRLDEVVEAAFSTWRRP